MNAIDNNKTIFLGDLNMEPDNMLIKNIKSYFVDTDDYNKENNHYTYPSNCVSRKIDYIFVSKNIKVELSEIINYVASDHLPIYVQLDV